MNTRNTADVIPGNNLYFTSRILTLQETEQQYSDAMIFRLVLQGQGQAVYGSKRVYINPGDLLFFPPYSLFSFAGFQSLKFFEIRLLPHFFQIMDTDPAPVFSHFHLTPSAKDRESAEIYRRLASLVRATVWKDSAGLMEQMMLLCSLYLAIRDHFPGNTEEAIPDDYVQQRIRQILSYISDHYTQPLRTEQISRVVGLNPQYFSSFFARYFHQSFVDFVNELRIRSAMADICHTSKNITEIAYGCGFQTYRSFSNAFRKIYDCSPSDYRSRYSETEAATGTPGSGPDSQDFHFLRKYLEHDQEAFSLPSDPVPESHLELDLQHAPVLIRDHRLQAVSVGSGYQILQENVYKQLKKATAECRFSHVHFRDIFGDLLSVYTEPVPGHPVFIWNFADDILQRILDLHLHPYIEIGFMPRDLASTKETLGFGYHPCIGLPKSLDLWADMVRSFLNHCLELYGIEEMLEWRFDFWNSANIRSNDGYWIGTQEEFFRLYRVTYRVFRETAPALKLGSPNFSLPDGISWYEDFLAMCRQHDMQPDYLSLHLYSCEDNLREFNGIFPNSPISYNYLPRIDTERISKNLILLKELLKRSGFAQMPLLVGEWNISYYLSDLVRDTAFMATYVVKTWVQTLSLVDGITYCNLSDISEQTRPSLLPFPGFLGLLSRDNLAKPAYNALFLLHKLDPDILYRDEHCVVTKGKQRWHILLYHLCDYEVNPELNPAYLSADFRYQVFRETGDLLWSGSFRLPSGQYRITSSQIDREHGCAFDAWLRMGSPDPLTPEISKALMHASYPRLYFFQTEVKHTLRLESLLHPHTVLLYEIRPA